MNNFIKNFKNYKYIFIDTLVQFFNDSKIDNKIIGNYIRAFHLSAPFNMIALFLFVPKTII